MLFSSGKIGLITSKLHVSDFHKLSFKRNVCDVNFQGLDHILNCSIWKFSVLLIKGCHWIFPLKFGSKKWREQNIALLHTVLFVHNIHCPSLQTSSYRTIILPFLLTLGLTIWFPWANEMWVNTACAISAGAFKADGSSRHYASLRGEAAVFQVGLLLQPRFWDKNSRAESRWPANCNLARKGPCLCEHRIGVVCSCSITKLQLTDIYLYFTHFK